LGQQGYGDEGGSGHLSVRDPILTDHFWMNPLFRSFKHIKVSDLVLVNADGEVVEGGNLHAINDSVFIHSAVYQARPDIISACHAHSIAGRAFSTLGIELDISTQDACIFWRDHTVYKYFPFTNQSNGVEATVSSLAGKKEDVLPRRSPITILSSCKITVF
jgi:ribulose-5-phosphate 4-epimerase/fuculose-1-phosphate aldolase